MVKRVILSTVLQSAVVSRMHCKASMLTQFGGWSFEVTSLTHTDSTSGLLTNHWLKPASLSTNIL